MPPGGWDRMAAWRDERSGEQGDLWHRALIDPSLLRVVGNVRGLRILEVACGNGYLARRFARAGAASVDAIDRSAPTIARARARERNDPAGVRFRRADASRLRGFADAAFDLVVANMALMDIEDAEGTVREVARVLAEEGRFVFSITHPCFDTDDRSMWVVERGIGSDGSYSDKVWRKVRGYREESKRPIPWFVSPTRTVFTDAFHRTLSTYSRILRAAGLVISRMEEPSPLPEMLEVSPQGQYIAELPLHLVVEAVRGTLRRRPSGTSERSSRADSPRSGSGGRRRGTGSRRRGSTPGW
jgi:ubiquinone/menaquinone biosynthesis C-methylase UbiE